MKPEQVCQRAVWRHRHWVGPFRPGRERGESGKDLTANIACVFPLRPPSSVFRALVAAVGVALGMTAFAASAHELGDFSAVPVPIAQSADKSKPVGHPVQLQGILALLHADYFAQGRSAQSLVIHEDNGHDTPVRFATSPPELGTRVAVTGAVALDGALEVAATTVLSEPVAAPKSLSVSKTQNAIFILVEFLDTTSLPFAESNVQAVARTNSNSVENYYQEVSYGQQLLNITVTPWLMAQMTTSTTCDYTSIANAANSAATAAGYILSNYVNRFYVMPHNSSCGWEGLAYVGSPYEAWSNGYNSGQVYAHELGHNFGLYHAGSVSCLGSGCSAAEYGDPYDAMGNQAMMHYDSYQKSRLGWLPAYTAHPGGTATYTLAPFEAAGGSNYAVKISAASNRTYWIEYRQRLGLFDTVSGVQFRVSSPFESSAGSDDSEVFNSGYGVSGLPVGDTYTDSTHGISVTVTSASSTGATIQVSSAALAATATSLTSSLNPALVGNTLTFAATVTGSVPTGTVRFTADGGALCTVTLSGGVAPCSTSGLAAGTHSIVAVYSGDSHNAASTSPTLSETVSSVTDTAPPVVTITSPVNGATVTGSVTISAKATDDVAVASLTLYLDGAVVATTNTASVSYKWNTRKAAKGPHTITAVAKDPAGYQANATIQVKR